MDSGQVADHDGDRKGDIQISRKDEKHRHGNTLNSQTLKKQHCFMSLRFAYLNIFEKRASTEVDSCAKEE